MEHQPENPHIVTATNASRHENDLYGAEGGEKSPLKGILTIAFVVLVAGGFAGLSWYAYQNNKQPQIPGEVPLVKADSDAIKIKPEDPGGMVVPNMDKTVYDNLDNHQAEALPKVERLLPAPEEPMDRAKIATTKPAPEPAKSAQVPQEESEEEASSHAAAPAAKSATAQKQLKPMSAEDLKTAPASKTHAKEGAPKQKQKAAAGGYRVQLGSFKTEKEATSSWAVVKKKYPSLLGNLQSSIERKDLGSKGIFYRLQAGTISKESEARLLCKKLIEEKQGCIIVSN